MSMYGKNHYNIVISLQLMKINEKKIVGSSTYFTNEETEAQKEVAKLL